MMFNDWEKINPGRIENIVRAINNVMSSHLADNGFFDFNKSR